MCVCESERGACTPKESLHFRVERPMALQMLSSSLRSFNWLVQVGDAVITNCHACVRVRVWPFSGFHRCAAYSATSAMPT